MIYIQHAQGVRYIPGGMRQLGDGLVNLAQEAGVEFYTGQKVVQLEKETKQIKSAMLVDETRLTTDYFVSNMEVIPAYEELLDENERFTDKLKENFNPTSSGLVLHLGVKKKYHQVGHQNFFFSNLIKKQMDKISHQHKLPDDPVIYLVNVNKTDPTQAPEGYENLKILPHIPHIQEKGFGEEVLIKLEKMGLTDLRDNIVTKDMWTPHDSKRMYNFDHGATYDTLSDRKKNKGFKHEKQSERYNILYFVGGTVNPGGMPMVTFSGQQVADMIVKARS